MNNLYLPYCTELYLMEIVEENNTVHILDRFGLSVIIAGHHKYDSCMVWKID